MTVFAVMNREEIKHTCIYWYKEYEVKGVKRLKKLICKFRVHK